MILDAQGKPTTPAAPVTAKSPCPNCRADAKHRLDVSGFGEQVGSRWACGNCGHEFRSTE